MTQVLIAFCLVTLISCAHQRGPASADSSAVAYDSMALGNVKASALKRVQGQDVCFDIEVVSKDIKAEQAQASNWSLTWVDQGNQFHLLSTSQRTPASTPKGGAVITPYGTYNEYSSSFTTCLPRSQANEMKELVLTPKEFPYQSKEGLKFSWNE